METYVLPLSASHLTHGSTMSDSFAPSSPSISNPARPSSTTSLRSSALQARLARCASTSLADLIPVAAAALKREDDRTASTSFARALARVKIQVQTRRLKEKYLTHEWIRLALGLPVDESKINHPVPSITALDDGASPKVYRCLNGRTVEIASWYEWRFNKSKFSIEEIESIVDRLRRRKQSFQ